MKRRFFSTLLVFVVLALAVPSLAHEHKHLGDWTVTFGMTPEPVFTDQVYKTTWEFKDKEGRPVTSLQNLRVTILYNGHPYGPLQVGPAWGKPGLYEVPTLFVSSGEYLFILSGEATAAGGVVHFEIDFEATVLDKALISVGG